MRISDWSSDVCSSDLLGRGKIRRHPMNFDFRALEISGSRMWERNAILQALDFIGKHEMTALVLHETDGLQKILYPRVYFDPYSKWKSAPARRGENAILNNRMYFEQDRKRVVRDRGCQYVSIPCVDGPLKK